MKRSRSLTLPLFFLIPLVGMGSVEARSPVKPATQVKVKRGYIDSHFGVSGDGEHLAYIHVLSDKKAFLTISRLTKRGLKRKARVNIASHTLMPESLRFTPDDRHVLITWPAKVSDPEGDKVAGVFGLNGKLKKKLGSFADIRFRKEGSGWKIITYDRVSRRSVISHQVTVHAFPSLKVSAKHKLVTDRSLRLRKPTMELVYFKDDYLKAVGKIAGKYDKKRDIRLPDKEAIYDLTKKKVISERPIKDAIGWEKNRRFRQKHSAFEPVFVLEGSGKATKLVLVRKNNLRREIPLGVTLVRFKDGSLKQSFLGTDTALISLTVDPQNPIVLKQRRSEPEIFHLYRVSTKSEPMAKPLLKLDSENLSLRWRYGKGWLAVMPLHKNWGLGAPSLQVYPVQSPR